MTDQPITRNRTSSPRAPNANHIKQILQQGFDVPKLALSWGVGESTLQQWINNESPPRWTLCAAEGLLRRNRAYQGRRLYIASIGPSNSMAVIEKLCEALDVRLTKIELGGS